ncbi:hypothetical protein QTP70_032256 [Hemibagrus guttatus]|uniref:Uncharacterized protein n=1 Tax=Hemibagrus guttatus TaxID=175788 RepID=A0AAE0Q078_9TELE|nr:hypothetical protein QTP70_032256 [Hemibagrus guttatus]
MELPEECQVNLTVKCAQDFLKEIQNSTAQNLSQEDYGILIHKFTTALMCTLQLKVQVFMIGPYANLRKNVILSTSNASMDINLNEISQNYNDVQTIMIGPKLTLDKTPRLNTSHASLDIDLIGISKTNKGSAAVMFMSYTTMAHQLKLFPETDHLNKIIMSTLVTVNLFKTSKPFSKPVNFTLKHINGTDKDHEGILSCVNTQLTWDLSFCNVTWTNSTHTVCSCKKQGDLILYMLTIPDRALEPGFSLSCVYWNNTAWVEDGCNITETNSSHTVCSCNLLATFALIMETDPCKDNLTRPCIQNFLTQIPANPAKELTRKVVERYLNIVMKLIIRVKSKTTDQNDLRYCGKSAVNLYEKLLSQMVEKTESHNISITLQNLGPAAVAFMSYTNMADILEPRFFKKADKTMKIMMSTVVSATFLKRTNTHSSKPVKFIFKHISALDPEGDLFCVYWKDDEWAEDGCTVTETNSTHTVCSCNHLSVFALIMEIIPCKQACAVMSGIRSFFFISGFVWMLIETVLLFLLVKNLSKIRLNQREVISMEWLNMIGYLISLVVVTLCTQFIPQNNVEEQCWDNRDTEKNFDTPIICIVATNMILYIVIIVIIIFNLNQLKNENLQRNNTDDKDLIMRVMIKSLAQFVILGCYWIFLYIPDNTGVLYNTFLFLNSQQGTFIFLVHCLLNQEVRQQYRKFVYAFFCFGKLDTTTQIMETEQ